MTVRKFGVLLAMSLTGCAAEPEPCPDGQARDNAGKCVIVLDGKPMPQPPAPVPATQP